MATDNLARGIAATKLSKKGGDITGDLHITGDLTVDGVTKTTEQETLVVKDQMIITNSDGIPLTTFSGLGIKNGQNTVYGLVYDPVSNSVKFGIGSLDSHNRFSFNTGEGLPIAVRDDSNLFVDGHLIKWDSSKKAFVDSGIGYSALQINVYEEGD